MEETYIILNRSQWRKTIMSNIISFQHINTDSLSQQHYFSSLLYQASVANLITEKQLNSLKIQSYTLLAKQCEKFIGLASTSIRVEDANQIMQSNYYLIGLYLKTLPSADIALHAVLNNDLAYLHEQGKKLNANKFKVSKQLYKLVKGNQLANKNYTYNATLSHDGIGLFFQKYDYEFAAHDIPSSIDYQLCNDVFGYAGSEFIISYLQNIYLENEFCSYFKPKDINKILKGYQADYVDLLINIYEHVLINALGCSLLSKDILSLSLPKEDVLVVQQILSKNPQINNYLNKACDRLIKFLDIKNKELIAYINLSLSKVKMLIENALNTHTLTKVFVQEYEERDNISYEESTKMSNEDFQSLLSEILECRYTSDKLILIKENVKSLADLEDILLNAYLNQQEVIQVLSLLEHTELAILLKRNNLNQVNEMRDLNEAEKILQESLLSLINSLPLSKQQVVYNLANSIKDMNYEV